jgi:DNA polymerase III delta prime subunit
LYKTTPTKLVQILTPIYKSEIEVPTVMLWGPPGVGKSDAVYRMAKRLQSETGKKVNVHDVRLLLFNPVDLRGLPVVDASKEFAKWLRPVIFNFSQEPDDLHILFLDELTAALPSVQASAYQLTLDRKIGEHELPKNVLIIAAGNRLSDKGMAHKMPTPLANRMSHFEIENSLDDWKEWAFSDERRNELPIHPSVIGFLSFKPAYLNKFDPNVDTQSFPTPRSWEFVSKYMHIFSDLESAFPLVVSTVGEGVAIEFKAFLKSYANLPNIADIAAGKSPTLKNKRPDMLCALSSAIVSYAKMSAQQEIYNLFNYVLDCDYSQEFMIMTAKDMFRIPAVFDAVKRMSRFPEWYSRNEKYLK